MSRKKHYCIVIDDNDQTSRMDGLVNDMKNHNIALFYKQINPFHFLTVDENNGEETFDINGMYRDIKIELQKGVRMIVCDNGLGIDKFLEGYDLIYNLRNELKYKHDIILYSGNINSILDKIFEKKDKIAEARKLVKCNIKDFLKRDTYIESLTDYFKHTTFDIKHELLQWLHSFENHQFMGHPSLERRTLGKIAEAIENDTALGVEFQKLFVEQGISAMIALNNLPNYE